MIELLEALARSTLLGLAVLGSARRAGPEARHRLLVLVVLAHLAMPAAAWLPRVDLALWPAASAGDTRGVVPPTEDPRRLAEAAALTQAAPPAAPRAGRGFPPPTVAAIWLAIAVVLLVRFLVDVRATTALVRGARPAGPLPGRRLGRVRLLYADDPSAPFVWGVVRPVIVLPSDARCWQARRLAMVLEHELAHLSRFDLLWNNLARLVCAVFWFSPLVWWCARALREEAERCCDLSVVRAGHTPEDYVLELVSIVRRERVRSVAASIGARGRLERRASAILDAPPATSAAATRWLPLATVVVAATLAVVDPRAGVDPRLATPQPLATGCVYDGGRHLNRWFIDDDGGWRWQVEWSGAGCAVRFEADRAGALAIGQAGVGPLAPGAELRVAVEGEGGREQVWTAADDGEREWLDRFVPELDAHTGFAAADRVRAALADDGTRGVFRLARAAQGDHAAARYLRELVRQRELDPDQLLTVLQLAAERVDNTAECQGLLASIVKRYDLDTPVLRAAFARAKARLGPRAAIDTFGRRSDTRAASR